MLPGDAAFKLYDTFGVPYDFIEDTAATQRASPIDRQAFDEAMDGQRDQARAGEQVRRDEGRRVRLTAERLHEGRGDHFEGYTATA